MTGPLRQHAADPGTPLTGPVPGTGTGTRPGGPLAAPVWAATEQLIPITEAEAMAHPFALPDDDFPYDVDPALLGDDYVEVTPETVGLADDPVAHALWALDRLTPEQLAETLAYYRPAAGHLRAVA